MAAFQVCLQVWLAMSLLVDGLAVAGQVVVAILSIICALTIYMGLRAFVGFLRIGTGSGPWEFLRSS
ncbi:hypothetical protein D0Y65_043305 [Glycine soja]|uniref:Uncharacterized protein n=1 Tax=Glycine soja TaxID=3848 RepID=A0A445GH01_GLYSO|nr:hypothetical protein D0Y65_043305 [Glycine soja]